MSQLKCAFCHAPAESMELKPTLKIQSHIIVTFWEHMSWDGSVPDKQVAMCRKCGIKIARKHLEMAEEAAGLADEGALPHAGQLVER